MIRVRIKRSHILDEASLSPKVLSKDKGKEKRIDIFIRAIENNFVFSTNDGRPVTIKKEVVPRLQALKASGDVTDVENIKAAFGFRSIMLPSSLGIIKLSDLKKPKELGGEDTGKRLAKEEQARGQLQDLINNALQISGEDSITIILKDKDDNLLQTIPGVIGVENQGKIGGVDPKADFIITRKSDLPKIYISHKDGTSPAKFGQWSGVTEKAKGGISKNKEVVSFVQALKNSPYVQNGALVAGSTIGRVIEGLDLKLMSIFGNESISDGKLSQEKGSAENVDLVVQGEFSLEQTNDPGVFLLGAHHMMVRIGFKDDFGEGYTPVLAARYTADGRANFGIKFARIGIYPINGRNIKAFI